MAKESAGCNLPQSSSSFCPESFAVVTSENASAKRKAYNAERSKSRIYLYEQIERWRLLKEQLNIDTDKHLAEVLLNTYFSAEAEHASSEAITQTESEIPRTSSPLSGIFGPPLMASTPGTSKSGLLPSPKRRRLDSISSSITPTSFNKPVHLDEQTLSASESEESDVDDDIHSSTKMQTSLLYQDSLLQRSQLDISELEKTYVEGEIFDTELPGNDEDLTDDMEPVNPQDTNRTSNNSTPNEVVQMEKCITFCDRIMDLLYIVHGLKCNREDCGKQWDFKTTFVGTCMVVSWRCSSGHVGGRWASQPTCEGVRAGNLLLGSCIPLSGNTYTKIGILFKFMNVKYCSKNLYNQYQSLYIAPTVNEYWNEMKKKLWDERDGKEIILSSDGRNDSPGHCAQYCTYSIADMEAKAILQINVVDVREVEKRKSPNMERVGFERGMDALLKSKMVIKEIVTDGHTEIAALMKKSDKYKNIVHQRDVWHGGKGIGKKVVTAAQAKDNDELSLWVGSVRNHFWFCSKNCKGCVSEFKNLWIGILHHVVDEHEWVLTEGNGEAKCGHESLSDEERQKPWLKKNTSSHKALRHIVLNKRFMNTLPYYTNFRHTGFLESFHNHMLMYCPKRHAFTFVGYTMRNQLAAIDYNSHLNRAHATTADGKVRYRAQYSKRTKIWRPVAILKPKQYSYIPELIVKIFEKRRSIPGTVNQRLTLGADDPRNINPNIAPNPRPSIEHLLQHHKSRFES